jgi:hypothetical protein
VSFAAGDRVRVADREHAGHHRTPAYIKGKTGTVACVHPAFTNPEPRAYGDDGLPEKRLYLVDFAQDEVWPAYRGSRRDRIYVDVFEHWLEKAE